VDDGFQDNNEGGYREKKSHLKKPLIEKSPSLDVKKTREREEYAQKNRQLDFRQLIFRKREKKKDEDGKGRDIIMGYPDAYKNTTSKLEKT